MNIILCGLPRCGKTTFGKNLSFACRQDFIDLDDLIESAYAKKGERKTCREICLQHGEAFFRKIEKEQLDSLKKKEGSIIALGGGTLSQPKNIKTVQSLGILVYLKTSCDIIWERIEKTEIPAFLDTSDPKKSFFEIAKKREAIFEKVAHFTLESYGQ